ncbi:MAG: energy transducer TonB [Candidatus Sericytochromatia bacterium]
MTQQNPFPKGKDFLAAELEDPDRPFKRADVRLKPPAADTPKGTPPSKPDFSGNTRRILSWEASIAIHLAAVVLWIGMPRPAFDSPRPAVKLEEPIPVEVAFEQPNITPPAPKVAPPAPERMKDPQPAPKAPAVPDRPIERQRAAAPRPLPPKPAERQAAPAPRPAQKAYEKPKAPDLQAALNARLNQGKAQEEQRESRLREKARQGADSAQPNPAAGAPQGNPRTSTSGLSGSLSSRGLLGKVAPSYPMSAQRAGAEGTTVVRVYVNAGGAVARTSIVLSSGFASLDRAAEAAARQWSFTPADEPGLQWGDIPFNFRL